MWFAVLVKTCNKQTSIPAIEPTTGEYHPSAVLRPRMITLGILLVIPFIYIHLVTTLEVNHLQVGLIMPDGEGAKVGKSKEHIATVGRNPWE